MFKWVRAEPVVQLIQQMWRLHPLQPETESEQLDTKHLSENFTGRYMRDRLVVFKANDMFR